MERFDPRPKATTPTRRAQARRSPSGPRLGPVLAVTLACTLGYVIVSLIQGTFALGTVVP